MMLVAERLTSLGYMQLLFEDAHSYEVSRGRSSLLMDRWDYMDSAPLKRRFQEYLGEFTKQCANNNRPPPP